MTDEQHRTIGLALGFPECCVEAWIAGPHGRQGVDRGGRTLRTRTPAEAQAVETIVSAYLGRPWPGCTMDPRVHYVPCPSCAGVAL